ncbi:MAG: peptidoglycan DD-metalloendopeptidase family protein [Thiohalobacteraceae bacterium]
MAPEATRPARTAIRGGARTFRLVAALAAALFAAASAADIPTDPDRASAELNQLRARIDALQKRLEATRAEESAAAKALREVEQRIGRVSRRLRATRSRLQDEERRLAASQRSYTELSTELEVERQALSHQVRAAYLLGRQEPIKLLLNQEDPARVGRTLTYYRYLNHTRLSRIDRVAVMLEQVAQLQEQIAAQHEALAATQAQQASEKQALAEERLTREGLLSKLQAEVRDQGDHLAGLQKDEQRLGQLVNDLLRALTDVEQVAADRQPFAKLKRKLPWPVAGELAAKFGERRDVGSLRWRGTFIAAAANQDVHAVASGRVAFADWLRGFGLLIIIDHGSDYMTLYGHNQSLYKEVGDWVEGGDVIAAVGDTGGMARPGLYFELRHQGEPQNPQAWCAGRPDAVRARR